MDTPKITAYLKTTCGWSAGVRAVLAKYNLPFTLMSDTDHSVSDAYGVYGEQTWGDKKFMGVARKTFLIDEGGHIKKVYDKVDVEKHADDILAAF